MDRNFAIFDMDGTLVDSMPFWGNLAAEYLQDQGLPSPTAAQREAMKTMTMTESSAYIVEQFGVPCTPQQAAADMNARMERHYREDVPLKPGVKEYLQSLQEKGVQMCVASATAQPLIQACLSRLGVADRFRFLLSCEDVGAGKSSPKVYLTAAQRLGAAPAETAVYEDALLAVNTARDAGFYVVGVYDESAADQWAEIEALTKEQIRDYTALPAEK